MNSRWAVLSALLVASTVQAGSVNGTIYSNFGNDLVRPIFPVAGTLAIFKNMTDANPKVTLRNKLALEIDGDWRACVKSASDGWVRCTVEGETGWIRRADFQSGGEYTAAGKWPFRWWLYVASDGNAGEEGHTMRKAARVNPYLRRPVAFDNIFFHVIFNSEGRAISPHNGKPTGDRVFVVGKAVYLAPEDPVKRNGATWLFLNFYNEELNALCPSTQPESCMSAVNLAPNWPGIKTLYEEPASKPRNKEHGPWFGATEVAFARHVDPLVPLMYQVPSNVHMKGDSNPITDAQLAKNREKPFCLVDCPPGLNSAWIR